MVKVAEWWLYLCPQNHANEGVGKTDLHEVAKKEHVK